jgi:transcriptional regulator with XRE-family HTH domain
MPTNHARAPALEALRVNVVVGRARARLSQDELAERAGISRPTLSRIERGTAGDVGIGTVDRLARALGVPIAELFVPASASLVDDAELARRAAIPAEERVDARALLAVLDEAADRPANRIERYSRAGRPPMAR